MTDEPEQLDPKKAEGLSDEEPEENEATEVNSYQDYYPLIFITAVVGFVVLTVILRISTESWLATIFFELLLAGAVGFVLFPKKAFEVLDIFGSSLKTWAEHVWAVTGIEEKLNSPQTTSPEQEPGKKRKPDAQVSETTGTSKQQVSASQEKHEERELIRKNPKMFRSNPLGFLLSVALVPVGIGVIILAIWWLKTKSECLIVTDQKTRLRKGILSKRTNDVLHSSVRNIQVEQGIFQRMMGTGDLHVSSSGQSGMEISISGIKNPEEVQIMINKYR